MESMNPVQILSVVVCVFTLNKYPWEKHQGQTLPPHLLLIPCNPVYTPFLFFTPFVFLFCSSLLLSSLFPPLQSFIFSSFCYHLNLNNISFFLLVFLSAACQGSPCYSLKPHDDTISEPQRKVEEEVVFNVNPIGQSHPSRMCCINSLLAGVE